MPMKFENLGSDEGMRKLSGFLTGNSYIDGYKYSNADLDTFRMCPSAPDASKFPHAFRWYMHIASIVGVRVALGASCVTSSAKPVSKKDAPVTKKSVPSKKDEKDDDDDLFGDDDEEEDEVAKEAAKKRADEAKKKKETKKVIERSQVVIEVKPWEADTNLEELAAKIKATTVEGLKWGEGHKLVPVAFGINKLLIQCIIIDDLVLLDDITELIEAFEDYVQSVDIASMNKV